MPRFLTIKKTRTKMNTTEIELKLCEIRHDLYHNKNIPIKDVNKIRIQLNDAISLVKNLALSGVSCSLPTKNDAIIKKHELLKEAESELSESNFKRTMIKGIEFGFERYHDWLMANYR
jgi:hypothetical protein